MDYLLLLLLAAGLGVDAFVVSIGVALSLKEFSPRSRYLALSVGLFHFFLILIGYFVLDVISHYFDIADWSTWISGWVFIYLSMNLVFDNLTTELNKNIKELSRRNIFLLSSATSIDALLVGGALQAINFDLGDIHPITQVFIEAFVVGLTAYMMTYVGLKIGCRASKLLGRWANYIGAAILLSLALYILIK